MGRKDTPQWRRQACGVGASSKGAEEAQINKREQNREAAKNKRISQQSSEQSRLIDQRKNNLPPINFESNEDSLDGFDMAEFNPR